MLILLRHGRTPTNASALLQGMTDAPLDQVGIEQARRAGAYIRARWNIDHVVHTSLRRTQETLEQAGFDTASGTVDDRWREISFGEYEERRIDEVVGELSARWAEDVHYTPQGGESLASLHGRVSQAFLEISERAVDHNVLVVSHATPIKSAVVAASGGTAGTILNYWLSPGSISVIRQMHGRHMLTDFNLQPTWQPSEQT